MQESTLHVSETRQANHSQLTKKKMSATHNIKPKVHLDFEGTLARGRNRERTLDTRVRSVDSLLPLDGTVSLL